MGGYHNFAKYSPVHKCVYFGGGEGSQGFYKYDMEGNVDTLARCPVVFAIASSVHVCDPVTGDFLVWEKAGAFYRYDDASDAWARMGSSAPFFRLPGNYPDDNAVFNTIAVPINTWGVILTATYSTIEPKVFLYRHAQMTAAENVRGPAETGLRGISAAPNPFSAATCIRLNWSGTGTARYAIVDTRGRLLREWRLPQGPADIQWSGVQEKTCGVFIGRLTSPDGKTATHKLILAR
jgi:hypothetical protein